MFIYVSDNNNVTGYDRVNLLSKDKANHCGLFILNINLNNRIKVLKYLC